MAATANSSPLPTAAASLSPRSPAGIARTVSPPWIQVVRGPGTEPEPERVSPETSDVNAPVNKAAAATAWSKKPTAARSSAEADGGGEAAEIGGGGGGGVTVVMGAELWPALSECTTKASPKNDPPEFGSIVSPLVTGVDTSSTTRVPSSVRSPSSTTQKPTTNQANHHSTTSQGHLAKQKSMKREGEGNSQSNGAFSHQSSHPPGDGSPRHHPHNHASPKPISGSSENPGKDNMQSHGHRESGQRNASGDHPHHRNSFRKGNGGPQSRGDGSHQTYSGRRRDQERGNHEWNHQKSFNGRDAPLQPSVVSRGFVRPPPVSAPFVLPQPFQAYMNPTMPDLPIFYLPPGMQFVAPVPQMYYPAPDPELYSEIQKQINYYFSNENLVRDTFLRRQMDESGWVSVDVISKFNRVKSLTNDTFQILEAVRPSSVVEVQGDKIRRRDDWMRWIMPSSVQSPKGPPVSAVTDGIQSVSLDERTNDPSITVANSGAAHIQVGHLGG